MEALLNDAPKKKRPAPVGVRVTPTQQAHWVSLAAAKGLTLSGYAKWAMFKKTPSRRSMLPVPNAEELARLLAAVGKIGANVNQCAFLANSGSWPHADRLQEACADIQWMRRRLMLALDRMPDHPEGQTEP